MRTSLLLFILASWSGARAQPVNLSGYPEDPFALKAAARVLLFVRTDCPITNRYAPELRRISTEFLVRGVEFWLIYADRSEKPIVISEHIREYALPGKPLQDLNHELVKRAHAAIAPEAAVFDAAGALRYIGRIDDRYVSVGKARASAQTHDLEEAIRAVLAGKPVLQSHTKAVGCYLADLQ